MAVEVVAYRPQWRDQFAVVATDLRRVLSAVPVESIEHVGSTAVPGLAAKPVLDIDIIVHGRDVAAAITALEGVGYRHCGDLGLPGREALSAPDDAPRRHVYVCEAGSLHLRNHLAVRDVLRTRTDLRDEYGSVKLALSSSPTIGIEAYLAGKSAILQKVLVESGMSEAETRAILAVNDGVTAP